ncbi:MAG TPA: hypothetical protein VNV66_16870 [Pilimelia sp.]|nr:hypothetical protein [Pilimelia sp.]
MTTTTGTGMRRPVPAPGAAHAPAGLRSELLDCVQANLALLADHWHGPGTHLALGATLRFRPEPGPAGLPTVEPGLDDQLAAAEAALGLAVRRRRRFRSAADLRHDLADGGPRYVMADAFHLPWGPYAGHRHLPHSFLLQRAGARFQVADAYHNDTPWGPARPGAWWLGAAELAAALPDGGEVVRLEPVPPARQAPRAELGTPAEAADFVAAYRAHPDRSAALAALTLETWLLARARKLHSAALAATGGAPPRPTVQHLDAWDKLVEQVYLAHRRALRGAPVSDAPFDRLDALLRRDHEVFRAGGAPAAPHWPQLRRAVARVAADVLHEDEEELLAGVDFTSVPTFSSFRMVDIVDRLEEELRVRFDEGQLLPERLHRVDDICRLLVEHASPVGQATAATPRHGGEDR